MKKILVILIIPLITGCATGEKQQDLKQNIYTYGKSSETGVKSSEKIDNSTTYEVFFDLEGDTECLTIEIESVYLQKSFPLQKIPKKTYFIVEKELILSSPSLKAKTRYVPLGRNFNNDWETFSPVKICTMKNDPLSVLGRGRYRMRFTTFEKLPVYCVITVNSGTKVTFAEVETAKARSK